MNTTAQTGMVFSTPEAINRFQLAAVKSALKLEKVGLKSRGGSIRKGWAIKLGMKQNAKIDDVIAKVQELLDEAATDPKAQPQTF